MKLICFVVFLMFAALAQAAENCDLAENDLAVDELNESFDQAGMSGEDHLIGLTLLYRSRLTTLSECLKKDFTGGITQPELKDVVVMVETSLQEYIKEMNEGIRISVENDRIGMATELTIERDAEVLELKKFISRIKKLILK